MMSLTTSRRDEKDRNRDLQSSFTLPLPPQLQLLLLPDSAFMVCFHFLEHAPFHEIWTFPIHPGLSLHHMDTRKEEMNPSLLS